MDDPSPLSPPPERDPRVYFAAERTTLAWIRTGIALMGFGFIVARFGLFVREMAEMPGTPVGDDPRGPMLLAGTSLVLLGVFVVVASTIRHFRFRERFERGAPFITPRGFMTAILSTLLALLGIAMTIYLLFPGQ